LRHTNARDALRIEVSGPMQQAFRMSGELLRFCEANDLKAVVSIGELSPIDPSTGRRTMMGATAFNVDSVGEGIGLCDLATTVLTDYHATGQGAEDL
jgi:hypothetical protein